MENVKYEKNQLREMPRINRDQLVTTGDLFDFKRQLIFEIKTLLKEQNGQPAKQWLKSRDVRKLPNISPGTLQNLRIRKLIPFTRIGGIIYHDASDIQALLEKPTLKNLEVKFKQNEALREQHALKIKTRIDLAIYRGDNTLKDLYNTLRSEGISIVARQNGDGRIYGMTFIDHQNRCVFNGSSLGRNYSAEAIQERCMLKPEIIKQEKKNLNQKITDSNKYKLENKKNISSSEKGGGFFENNHRFDLLEKLIGRGQQQGDGGGDDSEDEPLKQKRKKRLRL